eukprot:2024759-Pleurochrysis_carterae.AAC.2
MLSRQAEQSKYGADTSELDGADLSVCRAICVAPAPLLARANADFNARAHSLAYNLPVYYLRAQLAGVSCAAATLAADAALGFGCICAVDAAPPPSSVVRLLGSVPRYGASDAISIPYQQRLAINIHNELPVLYSLLGTPASSSNK